MSNGDSTESVGEATGAAVEDRAEVAYWRFDARRKGYGPWKGRPESERDAFKAEYRLAMAGVIPKPEAE